MKLRAGGQLLQFFRRRREDEERAQELADYLERETAENIARGMTQEEARRVAHVKLGNMRRIREEIHEMDGIGFLETLWQDVRYGLRTLRKSPGFTAVAVLTLALGIGANTTIFSLVDTVLLKQLPVKSPRTLVILETVSQKEKSGEFSYEEFEQIRKRSRSLASLFSFDSTRLNVNLNGESSFAWGQCVSGNFFSVLGVTPVLGRSFTADDDAPGKPPVVVVSYDYWKSALASDPHALGKTIILKQTAFSVIGVAPEGFRGIELGDSVAAWVPMAFWNQLRLNDHTTVGIMARLAPGRTQEQASAELTILDHEITKQNPALNLNAENSGELQRRIELAHADRGLFDLPDALPGELIILMGIIAFVLLLACVNIANLLLARAANRKAEIALRFALGATTGRLIRQLLTESVLLSAAGGAVGLLLSVWTANLLLPFAFSGMDPLALNLRPDARVLWFTVCVSVLAGVTFGIAPALWASQVNPGRALKSGISGRGIAALNARLRRGLVVVQIASSVLLLVGAGLLARSLNKLAHVDAGFRQEGVLLVSLYPTLSGYQGTRERNLYSDLQERTKSIPGVESASLSRFSLLSGGRWTRSIVDPRRGSGITTQVHCNPVTPQFFETMGIPQILGRDFNLTDAVNAPSVIIVSEAFTRAYLPLQNPIGQQIEFSGEGGRTVQTRIIGVVKDVRSLNLREQDRIPAVYIPLAQAPADRLGQVTMEVRAARQYASLLPALRSEMRSIDSGIPLVDVTTQKAQTDDSLSDERPLGALSASFGFLAVLLSCIGLYGVMAYAVSQRTHEIGIRLALGSPRLAVLWLVWGEGAKLSLTGIAVGLFAAIVLTRLIKGMLFGISATDPLTFVGVSALLILIALVACYIPARRAMRVDPMVALRYE